MVPSDNSSIKIPIFIKFPAIQRVWPVWNAISPSCWGSAPLLKLAAQNRSFPRRRPGKVPLWGARPSRSGPRQRQPCRLAPRVSICRLASLSALQTSRMRAARCQLGRDFHLTNSHFQLLIGAPRLAVEQRPVGQAARFQQLNLALNLWRRRTTDP